MRTVFALMFLSLSLSAQSIDEQIHALEEATPNERVALMNSIKEQLISMNEERRVQTIERLREKLQEHHETSHGGSEDTHHLNREDEEQHSSEVEHTS